MTLIEALRSRVNPKWPAHDRANIDAALSTLERFTTKRHEVEADANLSATGKTGQLREFIQNDVGKVLAKISREARAERTKIVEGRSALLSKATAKDSPFGPEIRAHLRQNPPTLTAGLLLSGDVDPHVQLAVLAAPAILSKTTPELRAQVADLYLAKHDPEGVAELAERNDSLELVDQVTQALRDQLSGALGMSDAGYGHWAEKTFVPTAAELRDEVLASAGRARDKIREAAEKLPTMERVRLAKALEERNASDLATITDPDVLGVPYRTFEELTATR